MSYLTDLADTKDKKKDKGTGTTEKRVYQYGRDKPIEDWAPKQTEEELDTYKDFVREGFSTMLGREPGNIGYDYWTKDLRQGQAHYAAEAAKAGEPISDKIALQKSLADFYGNLARHSPDKTFSHHKNTPEWDKEVEIDGKKVKVNQQDFAGEFKKEDPNVRGVTGSTSPYANVIDTGFQRLHGRTAGAIGMEYWGDEIESNIAKGMSENEAIAQFYKNVALNPEYKSNYIDAEGPNVQPRALSNQDKMMYGGGGNTTINLQLGDLKSQTASDQLKIMPDNSLINQTGGKDPYKQLTTKQYPNKNNIAGGTGGLGIGGVG